MLSFRKALSVLDKSSPYAVSTDSESSSTELDKIKNHLYIETKIEKAFSEKLAKIKDGDIIFLCGSSGDGKSELLTRYCKQYRDKVDFHLDATHSFEPQHTAIDTLNKLFTKQKETLRPLVVGINIGMLGNFAEEGDIKHDEIISSIKIFLDYKKIELNNYIFINFEAYPKFDLVADVHTSQFIQQILAKITENTNNNPLYALYTQEKNNLTGDTILYVNYNLLSYSSVQKNIIDLMLKARLVKDQFITARALLDFIHFLLTGPYYLFDNLFSECDNELSTKIVDFDPCALRKKNIDLFILQQNLDLSPNEFNQFEKDLKAEGIDCENKIVNQYSFVRLFYLFKDQEFSNNYHLQYRADFEDCLIDQYAKIWSLHSNYSGEKEGRVELKRFYKDVVLSAINKYANRNASSLSKDEFFVSSHNEWDLTVELELTVNYNSIKESYNQKIGYFLAHIKVEDKILSPVKISINLLDLMYRIVQGYRPNKHDKNTVVLLDEIVDHIIEIANSSSTLYLHTGSRKIKIKQVDQVDIEVSGAQS